MNTKNEIEKNICFAKMVWENTELKREVERLKKEVKHLRVKTHSLHKEIATSKAEGIKEATALMERLMSK
jgi:hypothetical protein